MVWQTGSGTQTNMNVNEVLANRASRDARRPARRSRLVHPNDDVNRSQSSNDVFPDGDACRRGRARSRRQLLPALAALRDDARARRRRHSRRSSRSAARICRTRRRSRWARSSRATPRSSTTRAAHIEAALPHVYELAHRRHRGRHRPQRATRFGGRVAAELARRHRLPFVTAPNKFEALAAHDALVCAHGALKTLAASLIKIANDVRWLASRPALGPRRDHACPRTSRAARSCRAR